MWWNVVAISIGAASGALLRWGLNGLFAKTLSWITTGTLAANLLGGLLIGIVAGLSEAFPGLPPQWRLWMITGFLGGLTTFSSLSLEIATLIQAQRWLLAATIIGLHIVGSVAMTLLGLAVAQWWK